MRTFVIALVAAVAGIGSTASPAAAADDIDPSSRMVLVLDSSGSMAEKTSDGTKRIDAAKDALYRVIAKLPDDQEVGLRVYGAKVFDRKDAGACTDSQLIVKPGTDNRTELTASLKGYKPYGETPIGYALQEAGKDLGDEGQRTIVLVSDGEPTCDPDPCKVAKDLSQNGIDLHIDVVGLDVSGEARDKLRCIAEKGHGTYYDVETADELVRSVNVSAVRASRPFDLTGEPVEGTAAAKDAPTVTTGLWLDEFPRNYTDQWYSFERTANGSTIHVGVAHRSDKLGNLGQKAQVAIFADPNGIACGTAGSFPRGSLGYTGTTSAKPQQDDACNTADRLYIRVTAIGRPGADVTAGTPMELAVYEEPPLTDWWNRTSSVKDDRTWEPLDPGKPTTTIVPGTSMSNAPVVSDGTYTFDINAGETQAVAVPLDWGHNLQAQIDAKVTRQSRTDYAAPQIQITGPLRQEVGGDYTDGALSDDWTNFGHIPPDTVSDFRWGRQAFTVGYGNRFATEAWWTGSSIPGLRYVMVSLPKDAAGPVPYTLTIKTNGTSKDSVPDYDLSGKLTAPVADSPLVTASVAATQANTAVEPDGVSNGSDDDDGDVPWVPIGLGAAGVLALGGAAVVFKRGRSGA